MRPQDNSLAASLVVATCRLGGLDVLWATLKAQVVRNFELILVDYWWEERKDIVAARWHETGLPFNYLTHVPPRLGRWAGHHDSHQAYNTGFALARTPLICIGQDYWCAPPEYVYQHVDVFRRTNGRAAMSGHNRRVKMPPVKRTGAIARFSIFEPEFQPKHLNNLTTTVLGTKTPMTNAHTPGWAHLGWREIFCVPYTMHHGTQNESVPTAALHCINGFDEYYAGEAGSGDVDLGLRLFAAGCPMVITPECCITVDMEHQNLPRELSCSAYTQEAGTRSLSIFNARAAQYERGERLNPWADNGGFKLSDPLTVEDVIANYEAHRP